MTYYERLNETYREFERDRTPASAQLVMLHLLHINNSKGNKGQFYCTDVRLSDLTRLSKDAVTQAKRYLKNKGYLDFKSDKKQATLYIMKGADDSSQSKEIQGVNQDKFLNKTKDIPVSSPEVLKCWYACKGEKLLGEKGFALIYDEKNYGAEAVIKAIKTASVANNYEEYPKVTYPFFKKVLENQIKEGERNDGRRNEKTTDDNKDGNGNRRTTGDKTSNSGNGTGNDNYDDFDYSWLED